ncbi:hypothetical protein Trihar35433_8148 [Trichoderma harzianum]|nr:hypothetical protein Trihar35433_8148 [Trichoderma harzianum]
MAILIFSPTSLHAASPPRSRGCTARRAPLTGSHTSTGTTAYYFILPVDQMLPHHITARSRRWTRAKKGGLPSRPGGWCVAPGLAQLPGEDTQQAKQAALQAEDPPCRYWPWTAEGSLTGARTREHEEEEVKRQAGKKETDDETSDESILGSRAFTAN